MPMMVLVSMGLRLFRHSKVSDEQMDRIGNVMQEFQWGYVFSDIVRLSWINQMLMTMVSFNGATSFQT